MKKSKLAGWYHYADGDGFNGIEYLPTGPSTQANWGDYKHRQNAYGPFKTFGEAKKDALDYFRTDMRLAWSRIQQIKRTKKVDSYYKGNK